MDLVNTVTSTLGIDSGSATGAIGSVFRVLKQQAPAEAFAAVEEKVPETAQWMAASGTTPGDGGGFGALLGAASGALGGLGGLGEAGGLLGSLSKFGLNADSITKLVPLVVQFLQAKVGPGVVAQLLQNAPALAKLLAGGGAAAATR